MSCLCIGHRVCPVCPEHASAAPLPPVLCDALGVAERRRADELGVAYADFLADDGEDPDPWMDPEHNEEDRECYREWISENLYPEWDRLGSQARAEALALGYTAYVRRRAEIEAERATQCGYCGDEECDGGRACPASGY